MFMSFRQSLVDVHKGDLPGHPFRGNQCVDEDWQPQPGDPCGSDDDDGPPETKPDAHYQLGLLDDGDWRGGTWHGGEELREGVGEYSADQSAQWIADPNERQRQLELQPNLAREFNRYIGDARVRAALNRSSPPKLVRIAEQQSGDSPYDHPRSVDEASSNSLNEYVIGFSDVFDENAYFSDQAENYGEYLDKLGVHTRGEINRRFNTEMWSHVVETEEPNTLYRGSNEYERDSHDALGDRVFLDEHHSNVPGAVREPSYFMSTSSDPDIAEGFANKGASLDDLKETADNIIDYALDNESDEFELEYKVDQVVRYLRAFTIVNTNDDVTRTASRLARINVPAGASVIPIETGEDEFVLAPGYQLVVKQAHYNAVVGDVLYDEFVEYDYIPIDGRHPTDPRGS